jgi:hypothetical protein
MRYIPSLKNENVNALMPQDAHKIASNMRFYAMIMAYSVNLLFGSFLLANNLGIWYYHFYTLEIANIVILSPLYDWLIWCSSAVVVIAETLGRIMQSYFHSTVR